MSHFYGQLQGGRGAVTRTGTKNSGLSITAASWNGAINTVLYQNSDGKDCYRVVQTPWHGRGTTKVLAEGVIGEE
jgi:hypothetical protein